MKVSMICFSLTGAALGEKIKAYYEEKQDTVSFVKKSKFISDAMEMSVRDWTRDAFAQADLLLFIGAAGIAVRQIAPYVSSKKTDPAVLVVDECGRFVISLLSGHLGGANQMTKALATYLGATPVITTATDLHHTFAVDTFAKENACKLRNLPACKDVSAALLAGEKVGIYSEFPIPAVLPEGLIPVGEDGGGLEIGIAITIRKGVQPFVQTATVIPSCVSLGMGCKKGKDAESLKLFAEEVLEQAGIYREAVQKVASIDLKKEEEGLKALASSWDIPFETYSSEELLEVTGTFSESDFVQSVTGVGCVCERSAVRANGGELLLKKQSRDGMTAAISVIKRGLRFE